MAILIVAYDVGGPNFRRHELPGATDPLPLHPVLARGELHRQAEVDKFELPGHQEEVRWLHVRVDDVVAVHICREVGSGIRTKVGSVYMLIILIIFNLPCTASSICSQ